MWFATPAANAQSRIGQVLDIEMPVGEKRNQRVHFDFDARGPHGTVRMVIREGKEVVEANALPPLLFEYLLRVEGGSLAGSFSRQCFEDLRQFRQRVVASLAKRDLIAADGVEDIQLVRMSPDGRLNPELDRRDGHGGMMDMATVPAQTPDPTNALIAQVLHYKGEFAILSKNNRVVKSPSPSTDLWLEQRIWGHRFHNDQTPWLLLLETLNVISAFDEDRNADGIFPDLGENPENRSYKMHPRSNLRHLLFRDRAIDEIANSRTMADPSQWAAWFGGLTNGMERFG